MGTVADCRRTGTIGLQGREGVAPRYFAYCRKSSDAEDRQVMSLDSQRVEALRLAERHGLTVIEVFREARSARTPGRPLFNEMVARIEAGEADGIIAWAPDRLARNSIDGGRVIYMLDVHSLHNLKFSTYTFENNSQGKFMLQIMFGQSKYYSDALSEVVKRGNRAKLETGWLPNLAPLGYLNDRNTKTIIPDPVHFPLVCRIFQMVSSDAYTPSEVLRIARDEWGFRTPVRRKIGGAPLAQSSLYKMLSNPFYAGIIVWGGKVYPGKHPPAVSLAGFERVRAILSSKNVPRVPPETFAYTGLIRCGACNLRVTAERKTNRFGSEYVYYHCSRRKPDSYCRQPSIEVRDLEAQIRDFLQTLHDAPGDRELLDGYAANAQAADLAYRESATASVRRSAESVKSQLRELTGLRIRGLLEDDEFLARKRDLEIESLKLVEQEKALATPSVAIEPFQVAMDISKYAVDWFDQGSNAVKRQIFALTAIEPSLTDKKLSVQAAKPFNLITNWITLPRLLAGVEAIREKSESYAPMDTMLSEEERLTFLARVRELRRQAAAEELTAVPGVPDVPRAA